MSIFGLMAAKVFLRSPQPDELAEVREKDGALQGYMWAPQPDEWIDLSPHVRQVRITLDDVSADGDAA